MHQLKVRDCQSGSKIKTQPYFVFKKLILSINTHIDQKKMDGEKKTYANTNQKKAEEPYF